MNQPSGNGGYLLIFTGGAMATAGYLEGYPAAIVLGLAFILIGTFSVAVQGA